MKTEPMHCEQAEILLAQLVYDEIATKEDQDSLIAHVEQCESCSKKQTEMKITAGLVKEAIEMESKPKLSMSRRSHLLDDLEFEDEDEDEDDDDGDDANDGDDADEGKTIDPITPIERDRGYQLKFKDYAAFAACALFGVSIYSVTQLGSIQSKSNYMPASGVGESLPLASYADRTDEVIVMSDFSEKVSAKEGFKAKEREHMVHAESAPIEITEDEAIQIVNIVKANKPETEEASEIIAYEKNDIEKDKNFLGGRNYGLLDSIAIDSPQPTSIPMLTMAVSGDLSKISKHKPKLTAKLKKKAKYRDESGVMPGNAKKNAINGLTSRRSSSISGKDQSLKRRGGLKQLEIKGATSLGGYVSGKKSNKKPGSRARKDNPVSVMEPTVIHTKRYSDIREEKPKEKSKQLRSSTDGSGVWFSARPDINGEKEIEDRRRGNETADFDQGLAVNRREEFKKCSKSKEPVKSSEEVSKRIGNLAYGSTWSNKTDSVSKMIDSESSDDVGVEGDEVIQTNDMPAIGKGSNDHLIQKQSLDRLIPADKFLVDNHARLVVSASGFISLSESRQKGPEGISKGKKIANKKIEMNSPVIKNEALTYSLSSTKSLSKSKYRSTIKPQSQTNEFLKKPIFKSLPVNPFVLTSKDNKSTFAMDTDTASYSIAKNYINRGILPPPSSIRMEEFINAFDYNLKKPSSEIFSVQTDVIDSKFGKDLALLRVGIKGKSVGRDQRQAAHFVYVIDTSGSMASKDRLGLIKKTLPMMLNTLSENDYVSIITYGDKVSLLAEHVSLNNKANLLKTIDSLRARGATWLDSGHKLGYEIASRHFKNGAMNNVMLFSDGVANVGATIASDLLSRVGTYRKQGISLTSVGFGEGSYNDALLEALANNGDGNYFYIDSEEKAKEVFVDSFGATFQTMAKNAKIQVVFNSEKVRRFRLIGYENRKLKHKDFRVKDHSSVDAGEVNSGQNVVALYECELLNNDNDSEIASISLRYRNTENGEVEEKTVAIKDNTFQKKTVKSHPHLYLSILVAEFAEFLRQSEYQNNDLNQIVELANRVSHALPHDEKVQELKTMIHKCRSLAK